MALEWSFSELPRSPGAGVPPGAGERFELRGELGRGGMGVVYRAHDRVLGRDVALKTLIRERARGRSALERVWREARATAALNHPGVVRVHDCLELPEGPTVVYELLEGCRRLSDLLQPEVPLERRLELTRQVLEAMAHAHAQGVVHRDLKPDNVLVDASGRARVTDFGLAWHVGADSLTRSGAALGTPHFMPPELLGLIDGDPRDPRVDVWSLGVLLYQAVSTFLPFDAPTLPAFMYQVGQASPEPLRDLEPGLDPAVEAVCRRALRLQPAQRFAHAGEMAAALEAALRGEAPARTRARTLGLGLAALCVAGAVAAGGLLLAGGGADPDSAAPAAPAVGTPALGTPAPALLTGWSLRAGEEWTSVYGYHVREARSGGGRSAYDMQYTLRLRVLSLAGDSAQLRADVQRIRFAMREEGGAPLVVDSDPQGGTKLRPRLPKDAGFELRLALPTGRIERVRGASQLKQELLAGASYSERMVLEQVLLDLEDELMRMDLSLLLGLFPAAPDAASWRVEAALRPGNLYPLRASYAVHPAGPDRLAVGETRLLEADPRLTAVAIEGAADHAAGRIDQARVTLALEIVEQLTQPAPDGGVTAAPLQRRVEITFLYGGARPAPLEALDRPP